MNRISSEIALAMSADGDSFERVHSNLVKIAEDFAFGFAKWKDKHYFQGDSHNVHAKCKNDFLNKETTFNIKQLLEIYKKDYDNNK